MQLHKFIALGSVSQSPFRSVLMGVLRLRAHSLADPLILLLQRNIGWIIVIVIVILLLLVSQEFYCLIVRESPRSSAAQISGLRLVGETLGSLDGGDQRSDGNQGDRNSDRDIQARCQ